MVIVVGDCCFFTYKFLMAHSRKLAAFEAMVSVSPSAFVASRRPTISNVTAVTLLKSVFPMICSVLNEEEYTLAAPMICADLLTAVSVSVVLPVMFMFEQEKFFRRTEPVTLRVSQLVLVALRLPVFFMLPVTSTFSKSVSPKPE